MSSLIFDLEDYTTLGDAKQVVVYESYIFLTIKPDSEGDDAWKSQITELYPLARNVSYVVTAEGRLTTDDNLDDKTGEFKELKNEPSVDRDISTDFTDTIREWISPYDSSDNKVNYGVALVNKYSDGSPESTDAKDVRYYSFTDESSLSEYIPYIDICYKIIDVPVCDEGEDYYEKTVDVSAASLLVEDESQGYTDESYTFGQDVDGKVYRTVIKFDVSSVLGDNETTYDVNDAWIKLNYLNPSDSTTGSIINRTVTVYKVTVDWDEDTVTWDDIKDNYDSSTPIGTATVTEDQVGGTAVWINIADTIIDWAENGVTDNYGFVLIDDDEDTASRIPQFAHEDDTSEDHHKPTMAICKKELITTTTTPTTPKPTVTSFSSTSSSSSTSYKPIEECVTPKGGSRKVIYLEDYLVIQDTPLSAENENYMQIGKTSTDGESILLIYFNMEQALTDAGLSTNIAVTDSKLNLRLTSVDDSSDADWNPGHLTLYPLKHTFDNESTWDSPWILEDQGPTAGVDYYSTVYAQFNKMNSKPEIGKWQQTTLTTIVRYIFTSTSYKRDDTGFLLRYITEDGTDPTHFLSFDSPNYPDSEFHPWMDICYVEATEPTPCEDGQVAMYPVNADTYLAQDGLVHGSDSYMYVGNSGWDGYTRALVDFDISGVDSSMALFNSDQSVYLRMWYDGPVEGKPYNDPKQMDRQLVAHTVLTQWDESSATNKISTVSGGNKVSWSEAMMGAGDDYSEDVESSVIISESEGPQDVWFNLTSLFSEWLNETQGDLGVVIKDSLHESIPGYFLKFGSNDNTDETMRPYFWICQEKPTCEPVDAEPMYIEDTKGCVSVANHTLNYCEAKNGPCPDDESVVDLDGYMYGVTAMWDEFHEMHSMCKCCVETETETMDISMDCSKVEGVDDYVYSEVKYIKACACQKCTNVSAKRKKRAEPSKTRLLLRSALKSLLRK